MVHFTNEPIWIRPPWANILPAGAGGRHPSLYAVGGPFVEKKRKKETGARLQGAAQCRRHWLAFDGCTPIDPTAAER